MAQLLAIGAYFYQAAMALGLVIAVSQLLPAADFTLYSFFVAISQFAAIAAFEWVRFACSRFYPGPSAESEAAERRAMRFGCAVSALACLVVGAAAAALGLPAQIAALGTLVAILQGSTDLHLSMLRFRNAFRAFSWLQSLRATILTATTLIGALAGEGVRDALLGLAVGYLGYGTILVLHGGTGGPIERPDLGLVRKHLVYGSASAGASVVSLLAPIGLKAIVTAVLGASGAAGALLAIDLLQRPFIMVVQAVQGTFYPRIVALHDDASQAGAFRMALGRYYALLLCFTLVTAAGLIAVLAPAALLVVKSEIRPGFLAAAPFVIAIAAFRALIQTMLPTPAHLRRRLPVILALAVVDCVFLNAAAGLALVSFGPGGSILLAGATMGAAAAMLPGLVLLGTVPFVMSWQPLVPALAALALALVYPMERVSVQGLAGLACVGALGLLALWLALRPAGKPRPAADAVQEAGRVASLS
jgi:hypothetical protein